MPGVGSSPFGSTPYGFGTETVPEQGGKILRYEPTNRSTGSRKISAVTRDYEVDSNGRLLGMPDVQQLVLIAMSTTKGSSAMRSLGHELASIDRISANFQRQAEGIVRRALRHLVDGRFIEIVAVVATENAPPVGRVHLKLVWRDLTAPSGSPELITTPIQ